MPLPDNQPEPKTVLVLEDDFDVRDSIMKGLTGRGFEVLESASPDEALNLVQNALETIGVAIVDMVLPVMWGDDFAKLLAIISPETKVIFISGHSEEFLQGLGSLTDGDIFFAKPYTPKLLLQKIRELLGIEMPLVAAAHGSPFATEAQQPQTPHFSEHLDLQ